jgi:hypothetical protein
VEAVKALVEAVGAGLLGSPGASVAVGRGRGVVVGWLSAAGGLGRDALACTGRQPVKTNNRTTTVTPNAQPSMKAPAELLTDCTDDTDFFPLIRVI